MNTRLEQDGSVAEDLGSVFIRLVESRDLPQVVALDARITGVSKQDYWAGLYERYQPGRNEERFFLVAEGSEGEEANRFLGFIIGEIRAWEFGSAPCGWVFAISVDPDLRQFGVGERLLDAISSAFKQAGARKMRTMVSRDNHLLVSFFRSEGLMAGPYIELEKDLP